MSQEAISAQDEPIRERTTPMLAALEARQDEVLKQLEELNKQLEAALRMYAKTPREEAPAERRAA